MKRSVILATFVIIVGQSTALFAKQPARFFKAECGTSAGYLKLAGDGTYVVIWREHMGVFINDRGKWWQKADMVTFVPAEQKKLSFQGAEVRYKDRVFVAWKSENSAGIVVPIRDTKQEIDANPKAIPLYVFFEIPGNVYDRETKQTYPFRSIKPGRTAR